MNLTPDLYERLEAFARDCVTNGDMTPTAARMLLRIVDEYLKPPGLMQGDMGPMHPDYDYDCSCGHRMHDGVCFCGHV